MDFELIEKAASDPLGALESRAAYSGRRLGLAFSSYFPVEVMDALGLEGAWLPPVPRADYPRAESVLQAFVCNPVRSATDIVLGRDLPIGLLASTTGCDARTVLSGIFRTAGMEDPIVLLRLPVAVGTETTTRQFIDALRAFCDEAAGVLGHRIDMATLSESCSAREDVREKFRDLFLRLGDDDVYAPSVYTAAVAAQVMEPRAFLDALGSGPPARARADDGDGVRVMISGSSIPSPRIIDDIESIGARITADDTCTGIRAACRTVKQDSDDLIEAIGKSIANRSHHGPVMLEPDHGRIHGVVDTARERKVEAVIMLHYKFCDPHSFEAPGLAKALDDVGIRSLMVETDRDKGLASRDRTRVQTLLEGIS